MKVIWYPDARKEQKQAIRYSNKHFGFESAQQLYSDLEKNNTLLLQNPNMGAIEQRLDYLPLTVRYLVVGNYKEYYYVKGDEIRIIRLWHCAQNPTRLYAYFSANPQIVCEPQPEYERTPKPSQTPDSGSEP